MPKVADIGKNRLHGAATNCGETNRAGALFHHPAWVEHHTGDPASNGCEGTNDVLHLTTGYEPKARDVNELQNSSVTLSFKIPAADQDVDDLTLGKILTEAYRGQVDYCEPEGMSVSQSSSSSVVFDGSVNLMEKEMSPNQLVLVSQETRTVLTSSFLKTSQIERMVDRSGKPDERHSSSAQIRTLLEEQRQTIVAEYREKVSHHELHAVQAEEERQLLQWQLWQQKLEFREAHQQSLT